jgi:transcriptional regulator with XRE-family HTH domain
MAQGSRKRPVPKLLAKKLRLIRTRLGVGQAEMARLFSKTPAPPDGGMISRFERGEREPNLFVILEYAKWGRVNPALLIDDQWSVRFMAQQIPKDLRNYLPKC